MVQHFQQACMLVAFADLHFGTFNTVVIQYSSSEVQHCVYLYMYMQHCLSKAQVFQKYNYTETCYYCVILVSNQRWFTSVRIIVLLFSQFSPVVTKGNEAQVHHLLIYLCSGINDTHVGNGGDCDDGVANEVQECRGETLIAGWAVGGEVRMYVILHPDN